MFAEKSVAKRFGYAIFLQQKPIHRYHVLLKSNDDVIFTVRQKNKKAVRFLINNNSYSARKNELMMKC